MTDSVSQAQVAAAKAYEDLFVPALFGQWTEGVAEVAGVNSGQTVLDVACGTGILARDVQRRVGPKGSVVGLDLNPGMLAVAQELAPEVEWCQGDASTIPFPDAHFDAPPVGGELQRVQQEVAQCREQPIVVGGEVERFEVAGKRGSVGKGGLLASSSATDREVIVRR